MASLRSECQRGHDMAVWRRGSGKTAHCLACKKIRDNAFRLMYPERYSLYQKKSKVKKAYGLSWEEYGHLISLGCAICDAPLVGRTAHIDHSHKTGKVRGALCHNCNTGLGLFKDNPQILRWAIEYLTGD